MRRKLVRNCRVSAQVGFSLIKRNNSGITREARRRGNNDGCLKRNNIIIRQNGRMVLRGWYLYTKSSDNSYTRGHDESANRFQLLFYTI